MKLFYFSIVLLAVITVESVDAIECYECNGLKGSILPLDQQPNCFDPFNAEGITTTQCDGRCFANSSSSTAEGFSMEIVHRGCMEDECPPTTCQDMEAPPGESGSGRWCNYCCDDELCNNEDLEKMAEEAGKFSCWFCQANVTDTTPPGSCASDDFNGEGAMALPCTNERCVTMVMGNQLSRACDQMDACVGEAPPGVKLECCDQDKCNVGSDIASGESSSEKPDDDDEGPIKCWRCDSKVTNDANEETTCSTGEFPAENVTQVDCPSGKCISYTYVGGEGSQIFSRGCLTPDMDKLGYCEKKTEKNEAIKDAKCCKKNLCNNAGVIAINVITILSALLVFSALA